MKNLLLSLFIIVVFQTNSFSQEISSTSKNAISVQVGSLGFGVEYSRNISKKLNLRFGGKLLKISDYIIEDVKFDDENFDVTANLDSQAFDVLVEYLPFNNSAFKIVTGLGYISNLNVNLDITYDDEVIIGDINFTKEELGGFITDANWSGLAPYLGIGFGRAIPKRKFGVALEIGAYYVNNPKVDFTASGLLTPSGKENANLIKDTFQEAKFIPNINLKLAYKF
jgi:hypothetical protein